MGACPLNALRGTETKWLSKYPYIKGGACPLNALRGTETVLLAQYERIQIGGMPSQRPSGH